MLSFNSPYISLIGRVNLYRGKFQIETFGQPFHPSDNKP